MKSKMTKKEYDNLVKQKSPNSTLFKDACLAFIIGGLFCVIGQLINFGILQQSLAICRKTTLLMLLKNRESIKAIKELSYGCNKLDDGSCS